MKKVGALEARDLMMKRYPCVKANDPLKEVMKKFYKHNTNILPVFYRRKFIGEIYKLDLLKLVVNTEKIPEDEIIEMGYSVDMGFFAKKAEDIMSMHKLTASEHDLVEDTAWKMLRNSIRSVPVLDSRKRMVGIITVDSIIGRLTKEMKS